MPKIIILVEAALTNNNSLPAIAANLLSVLNRTVIR